MPKSINRRAFLIGAGKYSLYSALAFQFGCTVSKVIEGKQEVEEGEQQVEEREPTVVPSSVAVLYGTRYGSTGDTADWICEGIGTTAVPIDVETVFFPNIMHEYDYFVIGSGVWIDGVHPGLLDLLSSYTTEIEGRIIASFIVCGTDPGSLSGQERIRRYFEQLHKPLDHQPVFNRSFGGRVIVEQLTEADKEALVKFYRKYLDRELESWDRTDPDAARLFGSDLKTSRLSTALSPRIYADKNG
jgi:menaquinone-dependent protoporphyrinogen IX oxidase